MGILATMLWTVVLTVIGGGVGLFVWLKTRPHKETWDAKIYLLGEGVRQPKTDKKGRLISGSFALQDLKPYAKDVLEKIDKEPGITIFRLQKLKEITPPVEGDVVDFWGHGKREVSIVKHKSGFSLLKKGYDQKTGELIFRPLPHDRINIIKGEIALRKDRLHKEKDILQAITPWIVIGITAIMLIAVTYFTINGFIEISENLERATTNMELLGRQAINKQLQIESLKQGVIEEEHNLGQQEDSGGDIPLIDDV